MLDSAIPYCRAFSDFKVLDSQFKCCPSKEDWVNVERIAKFLRTFYEVTTLFSGSQYPTANVYFHKVWKIHTMIREAIDSEDLNIKEMAQLSLYLEEPVLVRKGNENLDVLKFWKDNRIKYPELSLMARDLLSIPITSVSSESAFSVGGRVIGKFQTFILPKNAEAKLCSRDWLYGHQASDDSEEEDDIAIDMGKFAA
ncbi:zinc finger BED domain-containing protein RICESLEEPER 3-like [Lycium barbarum]|uniref:zinc finger BED domain-containing protein RICESLEEPER 3-like n=1 Tax=Lycium barbarum TaxID=112863 RepID=UPI00293EDEB3|nr:zinc finger BED domain-containing protein RICESLEEPER 3-like [Lycium barbarum]XP_060197409.1 zinc finger BED domain-containing protein RICESLEEPER 3-like [Lycium barbarum]XP_060197410.1 zinc finger BED domain-containing protein RICESLEEPER 3-like [Lycium barbarum]